MPGTLHIFCLKAAPVEYQVNYNIGANSYVKVVDSEELDEFLRHGPGLPDEEITALVNELRTSGHATEGPVEIGESHLTVMGFAATPSDE